MRWFLSLLSAAGLLSACTQSHLHEGDAGRVPLFPTTREAPDPTIVLPANFRLQELTGIDSRTGLDRSSTSTWAGQAASSAATACPNAKLAT